MKIELSQNEIEILLVVLEHIADTDDEDEMENDYGISMDDVKSVGKKLFDNCDNTLGRWKW